MLESKLKGKVDGALHELRIKINNKSNLYPIVKYSLHAKKLMKVFL